MGNQTKEVPRLDGPDGAKEEPLPKGYDMNLTHGSRTLLSQRLRQLADELDAAERYGVPVPMHVSVSGHEFGHAAFSATEEEFDAWAEYTDATVSDYEHEGSDWSSSAVDINGLPLHFHVKHAAVTA